MNKLRFTKIREVKSPVRGTNRSAGIDLFVPTFTDKFVTDLIEKNPQICAVRKNQFEYFVTDQEIILGPHAQLIIPSGIKIIGNSNTVYPLMNKSGVATKKNLNRTAEVVDEDYGGEIHIAVQNTSNFMIKISSGEKLIQMLELDCQYSELEELTNEEYDKQFEESSSERGTGGFGSTGTGDLAQQEQNKL